mmetsp:Transcript_7704/g.16940  ORF Transcript_7704/g.16940 Transcript_7704/m.16940 type:complete len:302 (+) Transcript_7704:138-1043(+)
MVALPFSFCGWTSHAEDRSSQSAQSTQENGRGGTAGAARHNSNDRALRDAQKFYYIAMAVIDSIAVCVLISVAVLQDAAGVEANNRVQSGLLPSSVGVSFVCTAVRVLELLRRRLAIKFQQTLVGLMLILHAVEALVLAALDAFRFDKPANEFTKAGITILSILMVDSLAVMLSHSELQNADSLRHRVPRGHFRREEPAPHIERFVCCEPAGQGEAEPASNACAICLAEFAEGETLGRLPCQHFFHDDCLNSWLSAWTYRGSPCPFRCDMQSCKVVTGAELGSESPVAPSIDEDGWISHSV